jgi:8-oxo-dGTP diphosphatase
MRRIGEPWLDRPYRARRGAYAVIAGARGLLLVDQAGELQLPGGGIDAGESPLQALHREVREETGWRIAAPRRLGAFRRYCWMPEYRVWAHKVQSVYLARAVRRLGPPLEPGHEPVWLPPALAARRLDVEGDREMVRRAIAAGLV